MEYCYMCNKSEKEARLVDGVYGKEILKFCEDCARKENLLLTRSIQAYGGEIETKTIGVRERMMRISGMNNVQKREEESITSQLISGKLGQDRSSKGFVASPRNKPDNLIDNYHWKILMERKRRKIGRKHLAEAIGEQEEAVRMIETQMFPEGSARIITKIEQYFGIPLRKGVNIGIENKQIASPARVLRLDPESAKNLTISDLKRMKEEREKLFKQEQESAEELEETGETIEEKKSWFTKIFSKFKKKEETTIEEDIMENSGMGEESLDSEKK